MRRSLLLLVFVAAVGTVRAADDHLTKAAECLDRGQDEAAVPHLQAHVDSHPDAVMIRAYLAELLLRTGRPQDAQPHFERFVREADSLTGPAKKHLVHCHTRLMEIAQQDDDAFRSQFHRGAGLVLLVRQWEAEPEPDAVLTEQTLAKAVAALRRATAAKPTDPRGWVYLGEAYEKLGQPSACRTARRKALAMLPDARLTDGEVRWLKAE